MPPRKAPVVNPQSRPEDAAPEPRKHADPSELNPSKKQHTLVVKKARPGWCKFRSKGRNYVEGALLEDADQEISLSPAASYRQRKNKNLELVDGQIPELPEDAPKRPHKNDSVDDKRAFLEYENSFIDSLEDGDPRVGAAPGGVKLIKQ